MRTFGTYGQNYMARRSVAGGFILRIVDADGRPFTFASSNIQWSIDYILFSGMGAGVDGVLVELTPVSTSLNVYTMATEMANCTATLAALPSSREQSTGEKWRSVTDSLYKAMNASATVYLFPGGPATVNGNAIAYLKVVGIAMRDSDTVVLDLEESDATRVRNSIVLPQRKLSRARFPAIREEFVEEAAPLWWGTAIDYIGGEALTSAYERRAGGAPLVRVADDTWLIADHDDYICDNPGWPADNVEGSIILWIDKLQAIAASAAGSGALYYNSGGRSYVKFADMWGTLFLVSIPPTRSWHPAGPVLQSGLSVDDDITTGTPVYAYTTQSAYVYFEWGQEGAPEDDYRQNAIGEISSQSARLFLNMGTSSGVTSWSLEVYLHPNWVAFATGSGALTSGERYFHPAYNWIAIGSPDLYPNGTFWHLSKGPRTGDGTPFKCRLKLTNANGNWVQDTQVCVVNEIRLRIGARGLLQKRTIRHEGVGYWKDDVRYNPVTGRQLRGQGPTHAIITNLDVQLAARGYGRAFGSWIDENGRHSGWTGTPIVGAVYTIESILRDELAYTTSEIDTVAFDAVAYSAYDRYMLVHLQIGLQIPARDLLQSICDETGLILFYSAVGKWTIKRYEWSIANTWATLIFPDDLYDMRPLLERTSRDDIYNAFPVRYLRLPWRAGYARTVNYVDNASITRYGRRELPGGATLNYANTDASYVLRYAERHLSDPYGHGVRSREHGKVRLKTIGWKYAHLEIGDTVAMDPTMDSHLLYWGRSWASKGFLVVGVAVGLDEVTLDLWDPKALY